MSRIENGWLITEEKGSYIMNELKEFFHSIRNLAGTRKFWTFVLGGALDAALVFIAEQPELAGVVKLLTAYGIWRVPNRVGAVERRR